ncbi:MAG TPA: NAD-dependent epimerase/dehydratase family protein [Kofleriaceae bacterium]|jgi:dihydroflavonol-4-reductase
MSRVAITGASGLLGGNLAAILSAEGHRVVATRRAGSKVDHLAHVDIDWRDADLDDTAALTRAFTDCAAVFHCAAAVTVVREVSPAMHAANVTGTANIIEACVRAHVARLIHTSSVVAVGLTTNGIPSDETATWNFDQLGLEDAYSITKRDAEDIVRKNLSRLDSVIVNPGYMIGPLDARPSSGRLIIEVLRRRVPGTTPGINNFADVRDVARGMIAAWHRGRRGERYILLGHEMSYADFFRLVARIGKVKPPRFAIPWPIAYLVGKAGDLMERLHREPLANSVQMKFAYTDKFRFASTKAAKELGYTVSPLEPAIRDAIRWFEENGKLAPVL